MNLWTDGCGKGFQGFDGSQFFGRRSVWNSQGSTSLIAQLLIEYKNETEYKGSFVTSVNKRTSSLPPTSALYRH